MNVNEYSSIKDWWEKPRNQGMSNDGSPKAYYNEPFGLKWLLAIPLLGTNLLIEYGYKSIMYMMERHGKSLKDLVIKISNDEIISEYIRDPNFKIDFSEEPGHAGYEHTPKHIINSRLREILNKNEWSLFMEYIYNCQSILRRN